MFEKREVKAYYQVLARTNSKFWQCRAFSSRFCNEGAGVILGTQSCAARSWVQVWSGPFLQEGLDGVECAESSTVLT